MKTTCPRFPGEQTRRCLAFDYLAYAHTVLEHLPNPPPFILYLLCDLVSQIGSRYNQSSFIFIYRNGIRFGKLVYFPYYIL